MAREEIVVVDDEKNIRSSLEGILKDEGYRVRGIATGEDLVKSLSQSLPDLVVLDVWLPGMDGLQALEEVKRMHPDLPVIMMTLPLRERELNLMFGTNSRIFMARSYRLVLPWLVKKGQMQGARHPEERGVLGRTLSDEGRGHRRRWSFFTSHQTWWNFIAGNSRHVSVPP